MTTTASRAIAVVLLSVVGMGSAKAEYRCDPAPTRIDRNACRAAADGPQALRQYVQRMRWLTTIQFSDYVNQRTIDAWEAMKRETSDIANVTSGRTTFETSNPPVVSTRSPQR